MRAVVQRVSRASVIGEGQTFSSIENGMLVYLGVSRDDNDSDIHYITDKIRHLRIFPDQAERMNLDVVQAGGQILVVSAFTVEGDARRGRRPTFEQAANPDIARVLYEMICDALAQTGVSVHRGSFQSFMEVHSINSGPVCVLLESRRRF